MRIALPAIVLILSLAAVVACDRGPSGPLIPSVPPRAPAPPPPPDHPSKSFEVSGIVTNTGGGPIAGAVVKMAHWLDGHLYSASVLTDATGRFTISFTASVLASAVPTGGFVATAQVVADEYEEFWRNLRSTGDTVFDETLVLFPMTRILPGDQIVLRVHRLRHQDRREVSSGRLPLSSAKPHSDVLEGCREALRGDG